MRKVLIAPSILSADFKKLEAEIHDIENGGAEWLHFDVMDGHFVNNISFGIPVLKSISNCHHMLNDVHIMISEPLKYIKRFYEAGADLVTFHIEATKNVNEFLQLINIAHDLGKKIGVSIKPNTPVDVLDTFLDMLDLVLVMSVEPGFGGQSFIPESLDKIKYLREYKDSHPESKYLIEVDGGINGETAKLCKEAGADVLVSGSYIFKASDRKAMIESLR